MARQYMARDNRAEHMTWQRKALPVTVKEKGRHLLSYHSLSGLLLDSHLECWILLRSEACFPAFERPGPAVAPNSRIRTFWDCCTALSVLCCCILSVLSAAYCHCQCCAAAYCQCRLLHTDTVSVVLLHNVSVVLLHSTFSVVLLHTAIPAGGYCTAGWPM